MASPLGSIVPNPLGQLQADRAAAAALAGAASAAAALGEPALVPRGSGAGAASSPSTATTSGGFVEVDMTTSPASMASTPTPMASFLTDRRQPMPPEQAGPSLAYAGLTVNPVGEDADECTITGNLSKTY